MLPADKRTHKSRIGEILLNYDLISHEQLAKALEIQIQSGKRLGSVLQEMGYLDNDTLLNVLSKQYNLPYVNLFEVKVSPEILNLLHFEQVKSYRVLPLDRADDSVSVAMVDPKNIDMLRDVEFTLGSSVRPHVVPHFQMERAIMSFEKEGYGGASFEGKKLREDKVITETNVPGIHTLLRLLIDFNGTDLHLAAGAPPSMRINGELKRLSMPDISAAQMKDFVSAILTKDQMESFEKERELDFVLSLSDSGRFRMNIYKQRTSISLSARLIHEKIPSISALNLPEWISDYALKPQGLILLSGLVGHGKTTTLAALVNVINSNRKCNIVTLEDPIEYLHKHNKSNVNQREVGIDTRSFAEGLKHVIRQDPDVIIIGDLKDPESVAIALEAAEAGHHVIGAIHSLNSVTAIERILNIFPERQLPQIRTQLADTLLLVFSQKLVPGTEDKGRVLAYEKISNSQRVANLIREGKPANIRSLMLVAAEDLTAMDQSIARLCLEGKISFENGLKFSDNPAYYKELIGTGRI